MKKWEVFGIKKAIFLLIDCFNSEKILFGIIYSCQWVRILPKMIFIEILYSYTKKQSQLTSECLYGLIDSHLIICICFFDSNYQNKVNYGINCQFTFVFGNKNIPSLYLQLVFTTEDSIERNVSRSNFSL